MKRHSYILKVSLPVLLTVFFVNCNFTEQTESNQTIISISSDQVTSPDFKALFEHIEIDTLEMSEQSMIGPLFYSQHAIYVPHQYYIITDKQHQIKLFDTEGRFLSSSSDCIGEGPNQYLTLQDLTYNSTSQSIDILDPFSTIYRFDTSFNFIEKHKIIGNPKDQFRKIYSFGQDKYALMDDLEKGTVYLYDKKTKEMSKIDYPGTIASQSANYAPFHKTDSLIYFVPPEINNTIFTFDTKKEQLNSKYVVKDQNCITIEDLPNKDSGEKEIAKFILSECNKFAPINRLANGKYLVSTYLKQNKLYINLFNIQTHHCATISKLPGQKLNLPTFFHLEENVLYATVQASELSKFIDKDLVINKEILNSLDEDSNPCVVKYKLLNF